MDKPIGYWLKHVHDLIETRFDGLFAAEGLTRRHWQVLNSLARETAGDDALAERLRPFWDEHAIGLGTVLADLAARGWIETRDGRRTLTATGRTARDALAAAVVRQRELLMRGLTQARYEETVRTLRTMAANLAAAA